MGDGSRETVVVGSGASGLTIALLMAKAGRTVRIVETRPEIGGYLNRFTRCGHRFDTGFHFTGGFEGVLGEMLAVLGIADVVRELPLRVDVALPASGRRLTFPEGGVKEKAALLRSLFPRSAAAVDAYYRTEREVCLRTPMFSLRQGEGASGPSPYDAVTLAEYLTVAGADDDELRTLLGLTAVCHGSPPCEVPLTHHCRASYGLDERIRAVDGGGDAFLGGFRRELAVHRVTVMTGVEVVALDFASDGSACSGVRLSDGTAFPVDDVFFAVHPSAFLPLLPERLLTPSLRRRMSLRDETCAFFTVSALAEPGDPPPTARLFHYISANDLDAVLLPGAQAYGTGMMLTPPPAGETGPCRLSAFRTMHVAEVPAAPGTSAYADFKAATAESVLADVAAAFPELRGRLRVADVSTPLTCRRYVPPSGSAYGLRRKVAQAHVAGRFAAANLHALGHNALAPGVAGVMSGAFLEFARTVGPDTYREVVLKPLDGWCGR